MTTDVHFKKLIDNSS